MERPYIAIELLMHIEMISIEMYGPLVLGATNVVIREY